MVLVMVRSVDTDGADKSLGADVPARTRGRVPLGSGADGGVWKGRRTILLVSIIPFSITSTPRPAPISVEGSCVTRAAYTGPE